MRRGRLRKNLALVATHPIFTLEDYLGFERFANERHEFLDGSVYAMAGESLPHNTICFNLCPILGSQLTGTNCQGFSPNMKVATNETKLLAYPDLAIVCGEPTFFDNKEDVLTNPVVIFEVLSRFTQNYDRGEKFLRYTNYIKTLEDYILISQDRPFVEHFSRATGWEKSELTGLGDILRLDSIQCEIPLTDLYYLVKFTA